ncbi:MAG: glucose 1-dehydrogenase [marine benthic group bacterium]|nr:glucose 1-dehydrogenase [Candidatus Carthagonibacter metallireducens]MCL7975161.1 glucose 1-dehydrogenase [Gemmatimonadota bacterium]MCL7979524.1 glucose 1-dehydrogenase [Gemmatimonadota bacterium]MCL7985083.1 glucose 1-dehydrogenase [Gemmatimonadota bacterium]
MADLKAFDLAGKVALVTGGNGGIGLGIAKGLAEAGAKVAVWGRNEEKNASALAALEETGAEAIAMKVDVGERERLQPALSEVESALGPVSILVNNAAIGVFGGVLDLSEEDWDRVIEIDLTSCFLLSKYAAQSMTQRGAGKIINLASTYSLSGCSWATSYSAAKGGIMQLTKSLAIELAPHNIQVNAILPGWIETDLTGPIKEMPLYDEILMRTPAGRFGTPEECAGAAVFLSSDASRFVTGTALVVDGGYAIR